MREKLSGLVSPRIRVRRSPPRALDDRAAPCPPAAQVPFPVYGLQDNKDPFLLQKLMKKVGTSDWLVHGIYGGTTFVLDDRNRILFKLEKEDVRKLPEKLASLD
jgi:hypothetical protein